MIMKNVIDVLAYDVIVFASTYKDVLLYSYNSSEELEIGTIVHVPWGHKSSLGLIYDLHPKTSPSPSTVDVKSIISTTNVILPNYMTRSILWLCKYYQISPFFVTKVFFNKSLKFDDNPSILINKYKSNPLEPTTLIKPIEINKTQGDIINSIISSDTTSHLLFGVTGSGKTHIYMKLMLSILEKQESVLLLVPEISLITPTIFKIRQYFSGDIISYSSELSLSKRAEAWYKIYSNKKPILIIGTRSSLNLPIANLGLIIMDEEHDHSYYHSSYPRYSSKLLAGFIAKYMNIKIVLGSATPDISSLLWAQQGHIKLHRLEKRAMGKVTNNIKIIEQKDLQEYQPSLIKQIRSITKINKKVLYLINQRGNYRRLYCQDCAYIFNCSNCGSSLIWHSDNNKLICHNCGLSRKAYHTCPNCHKHNLVFYGQGTKEIEKYFKKLMPELNIIRLDRDESVLERKIITTQIINGNFDILIGTQIISKGLDLADIGLIIVDAQSLLSSQDFLAEEKFIQTVIQIIGRGGRRKEDQYEVIILGGDSANVAIGSILKEQYELFFQKENYLRQKYNFPPHSYLLLLTINGKDEEQVKNKAYKLLREYNWSNALSIEPPYKRYYKVQGKVQYSILIKAKKRSDLIIVAQDISKITNWQIELDPISID